MAQTDPVLSGTFVQLNGQLAAMDDDAWLAELDHMRAIGMDTIIIQYSRYGEVSYFPAGADAAAGAGDAPAAAGAGAAGEQAGPALPPSETIGVLTWQAPAGATAQHLRLTVTPNSREWTMIPEVRVLSGGTNIAAGLAYRVTPPPAGNYLDPDAATGGKLTDGFANFAWSDMVGWQNPGDRIIIDIDLGAPTPIDEVVVDFMRSDISGVELPSALAVSVSGDGANYLSIGTPATWAEASTSPDSAARDPIGTILRAAEQRDVQVWLGLSLDPNYWQGVFDPVASAESNTALMLELERLYGASPALAGYYLPEEIDDRSFISDTAHEAMTQYLAAMTTAAHDQVGRPVMVAPYFGINPNGEAYAAWWDETLERAPLDVIAMQDGVGTRRTTAAEGVPVYAALAEVAARHGVALWSDLEVFEQTHGWPVDDLAWQAQPARIETVVEQLTLEAPYVTKFVTFDFTHHMSPRLGGMAAELYRSYQDYLEGLE
jgi:hypothetical protein